MSVHNVEVLASYVDELISVDDPFEDSSGGAFLRACVVIDTDKTLLDRIWIPREGRDPIRATIKYENLQDFCYACGRLGHTSMSYGKDMVLSFSVKCRYGDNLRVIPIRFPMSIRREMKESPLSWYDEEMRKRGDVSLDPMDNRKSNMKKKTI